MFIITDKENIINAISSKCEVNEDVRNIVLDNYAIAYAPNEKPNINEVAEIPEGVEIGKYCYTETEGFTRNPNYEEPLPTAQEQINDLYLALAELGEIVGGNE